MSAAVHFEWTWGPACQIKGARNVSKDRALVTCTRCRETWRYRSNGSNPNR